MKRLANLLAGPFRLVVQNIPMGAETKAIMLEDWVPEEASIGGGRITLLGEVAHPMAMSTS